jgi:hypothetical protein
MLKLTHVPTKIVWGDHQNRIEKPGAEKINKETQQVIEMHHLPI